ncbi:hypothetical protein [Pseudonocardia sp. GCM10023141]|uniref:hypothetical protein n=1 Tax=Pseudonocardia sp. GCM10023141 TaxID=3252653 RepID=UPI00361EB600
MQLPQSAEVLVPLGAGVVIVIIALVVLIVRARRRRPDSGVVGEPTAADWTGEAAAGPIPAPAAAPASTPPPRHTVADEVSHRDASRREAAKPLPPSLDAMPAPQGATVRVPEQPVAVPVQRDPSVLGLAEAAALPLFAGPGGEPVAAAASTASGPENRPAAAPLQDQPLSATQPISPQPVPTPAGATPPPVQHRPSPMPPEPVAPEPERAAATEPERAVATEPSDAVEARTEATSGSEVAGEPEVPILHNFAAPEPPADEAAPVPQPRPTPPRPSPSPSPGTSSSERAQEARMPASTSGSSRTVAAAVAQALAVRAAASRSPGQPAGPTAPAEPGTGMEPPRGDARDRLLAVLLNDPVRAVGAADELEACREQLERLTHAVRHERGRLAEVLVRLAGSGLREDQLARLSGLPADEVHELMAGTRSRAG